MLYHAELETPFGKMIAVCHAHGVCLLEFTDSKGLAQTWQHLQAAWGKPITDHENNIMILLKKELHDYYSGSLKTFSVPIAPIGTPFQQHVWQILSTIAYGKTISYAQQAAQLGNPKAIRAVAAANSRNPIAIIIPCHRVIGSNGTLVGYAGGLERKRALLAWEAAHSDFALA